MLTKHPEDMRKTLLIALLFAFAFGQAQEMKPSYEAVGDQVKATYYHADGTIHKQGFFKDQKLNGQWIEFDQKGNKVAIAYYKKGKKVGTWFQWKGSVLRQINYENNTVASVSTWREDTKVAVNR